MVLFTIALIGHYFEFFNKNQSNEKISEPLCKRTEMYDMPEEFKRALSLVEQRVYEAAYSNDTEEQKRDLNRFGNYHNCIDIEYADLSDEQAEGVFIFDRNSTPDRMVIYVDQAYTSYDDLLTAILLHHETVHVNQYMKEILDIESLSCVDKEVNAFLSTWLFIRMLNDEEKASLAYRLDKNPNKNSAYGGIMQLAELNYQAARECKKETTGNQCELDRFEELIREMVTGNPGYQEQCKLAETDQIR